jgi:hypothetical protein
MAEQAARGGCTRLARRAGSAQGAGRIPQCSTRGARSGQAEFR